MENFTEPADAQAPSPPQCDLSESFIRTAENARYVCYEVLTHIFVAVCVPGYAFTLMVMNRQTGTEKAYFYQLFLTGSKTFEMAVMAVFAYTFSWAGVDGDGHLWFKRSYVLMWFTAKVSLVLTEIAMTTSLYLAVSMSADRLFAIVRPVEYKTIRRRRHQYVALTGSVLIGLGTALFNVALFTVVPNDDDDDNGGTYSVVVDDQFASSSAGDVLTHISSTTRIFGLLSLFLCNTLLVKNFRRRLRQVSKLVANQSSVRERSRNAKERTLVLLTLCQSAFCAFVILSEIVFYSFSYSVPSFYCYTDLYSPVLNMVIESTYMAEVVAPFLISDQLRLAAMKLLNRFPITVTQSVSREA